MIALHPWRMPYVILVLKDSVVLQDYLVLMPILVLMRNLGLARYLVYFSFVSKGKYSADIFK
jgi:hypothetical protein